MRMTARRKAISAAIETFDAAAQVWGFVVDQGSDASVIEESKREYETSRSALEALIHGPKPVVRISDKRRTLDAAIKRFDDAAQNRGWQMDEGSGQSVIDAKAEHHAARTALEALVLF